MLGQLAEGLNCLAEAAAIIETTEERSTRLSCIGCDGDLLNSMGDRPAAEQNYHQASQLRGGRAQSSFNYWHRSALPASGANRASAAKLVTFSVIYNWFTEGSRHAGPQGGEGAAAGVRVNSGRRNLRDENA